MDGTEHEDGLLAELRSRTAGFEIVEQPTDEQLRIAAAELRHAARWLEVSRGRTAAVTLCEYVDEHVADPRCEPSWAPRGLVAAQGLPDEAAATRDEQRTRPPGGRRHTVADLIRDRQEVCQGASVTLATICASAIEINDGAGHGRESADRSGRRARVAPMIRAKSNAWCLSPLGCRSWRRT